MRFLKVVALLFIGTLLGSAATFEYAAHVAARNLDQERVLLAGRDAEIARCHATVEKMSATIAQYQKADMQTAYAILNAAPAQPAQAQPPQGADVLAAIWKAVLK